MLQTVFPEEQTVSCVLSEGSRRPVPAITITLNYCLPFSNTRSGQKYGTGGLYLDPLRYGVIAPSPVRRMWVVDACWHSYTVRMSVVVREEHDTANPVHLHLGIAGIGCASNRGCTADFQEILPFRVVISALPTGHCVPLVGSADVGSPVDKIADVGSIGAAVVDAEIGGAGTPICLLARHLAEIGNNISISHGGYNSQPFFQIGITQTLRLRIPRKPHVNTFFSRI